MSTPEEVLSALERVAREHHNLWRRFARSTGAIVPDGTDVPWDDLGEAERTARLRTIEYMIRQGLITYGRSWGGRGRELRDRADVESEAGRDQPRAPEGHPSAEAPRPGGGPGGPQQR